MLTTEQIKHRNISIKGKRDTDSRDFGKSRNYKWITSYVDKELFGLTHGVKLHDTTMVFLTKTVQWLTKMASRYMLGGNLHGAVANTLMGLTEV